MSDPQIKDTLARFTLAAKSVIYDKAHAQQYLPMMDTRQGSIMAVQSVLEGIDKIKKVDPSVMPLLAVNIYLLMVDVANQVARSQSGGKSAPPDSAIVKQTIAALMQAMGQGNQGAQVPQGSPAVQGAPQQQQQQQQPQQPQQPTPQPPQGLIRGAM